MPPSVIRCPSCGYVLKQEDLKQHACPYCRTAFVDTTAGPSMPNLDKLFSNNELFSNDDGLADLLKGAMSQANAGGESTRSVTTRTTQNEAGDVISTVTTLSTVSTTRADISPNDLKGDAQQIIDKIKGYMEPQAMSSAPAALAPGQRVLVAWSDGNRYPAKVQKVSDDRCEVQLQDGRSFWVEKKYLSPSK